VVNAWTLIVHSRKRFRLIDLAVVNCSRVSLLATALRESQSSGIREATAEIIDDLPAESQ